MKYINVKYYMSQCTHTHTDAIVMNDDDDDNDNIDDNEYDA